MDSTEISNNVAAVIDNEDFAMVDATTDLKHCIKNFLHF